MEEKQKTWNLPPPNLNFWGREELLKDIEKGLRTEDSTHFPVIVTALHGLGGIGKTSLVIRFAHKILEKYPERYRHIFWIRADTLENLQTQYFELAKDLGIQGEKPEDTLKAVKQWLESNPLNLVIYDDVPNFDSIRIYLPGKGCHLLMTSRYTKWPLESINIKVDCFTKEECRDYIQAMLGQRSKDTIEDVDALGEAVGRLPLALAQACGYLTQVNEISVKEYLKRYEANKETRIQLLSNSTLPAGNDHDHDSVATTFSLSLQAIQQKSPLAAKLLTVCAFLHLQKIPDFLLKEISSEKDFNPEQNDASEALTLLGNFSLISRDLKSETCSIHVLVQEVIRSNLDEAEAARYVNWIYEVLVKNYPNGKGKDKPEDIKVKLLLLPHFENLLQWIRENKRDKDKIIIGMLECMCDACFYLNDAERQRNWRDEQLSLEIKYYGEDSLNAAVTRGKFANTYSALGNAQKGKELFDLAMPIFEKCYAPTSFEFALKLIDFGTICGILGETQQWKESAERALIILEKYEHGSIESRERCLQVAIVKGGLGIAYGVLGESLKGKELLADALKILEGRDEKSQYSIYTCIAKIYLGCINCSLRNESDGKSLIRDGVLLEKKHHEEDGKKEKAKFIFTSLGWLNNVLGKTDKWKKLLERCLPVYRDCYGAEHEYTKEIVKRLREIKINNLVSEATDKDLAVVVSEKASQNNQSQRENNNNTEATNILKPSVVRTGNAELALKAERLNEVQQPRGKDVMETTTKEMLPDLRNSQDLILAAPVNLGKTLDVVRAFIDSAISNPVKFNLDLVLKENLEIRSAFFRMVVKCNLISVLGAVSKRPDVSLVSYSYENKSNLLHIAIMESKSDLAKFIVENHLISRDSENDLKQTPLQLAVCYGDKYLIRFFYRNVKQIAEDRGNFYIDGIEFLANAVHLAVMVGDLEKCQYFLGDEQMGESSKIGFHEISEVESLQENYLCGNLIHIAIFRGHNHILKWLLESSTKESTIGRNALLTMLTARNKMGLRPIDLAAYVGNHLAIKELLFHKGVNLASDTGRKNALHWAIEGAQYEAVKLILSLTRDDAARDKLLNVRVSVGGKGRSALDVAGYFLKRAGSDQRKEMLRRISNVLDDSSSSEPNRNDPPENLVWSGGGPRGVGYVGAVEAMQEKYGYGSLWSSVRRIGGSSAGAITSMLLAIGCSAEFMRDELGKPDFLKRFVDDRDIEAAMKMLTEEGLVEFLKNGLPLLLSEKSFLEKAISLYPCFGPFYDMGSTAYKTYNLRGVSTGNVFREWADGVIAQILYENYGEEGETEQSYRNFTFGELKKIIDSQREGKKSKRTCKHLFIVATKFSVRDYDPSKQNEDDDFKVVPEIVVFSTQDPRCEDFIIADAVRASMSIPFIFVPHKMQIKFQGKPLIVEGEEYMDGGINKNYPLKLFDKISYVQGMSIRPGEEMRPHFNQLTLGFKFIDKPSIQKPSEIFSDKYSQQITDVVRRFWSVCYNSEALATSFDEAYGYRVRTISLDSTDIGLYSFNLEGNKLDTFIETCKRSTSDQLKPESSKLFETDRGPKIEEVDDTEGKESVTLGRSGLGMYSANRNKNNNNSNDNNNNNNNVADFSITNRLT